MAKVEIDVLVQGDALTDISKLKANLANNVDFFLSELADEVALEMWQHYEPYAGYGDNQSFTVQGHSSGKLKAETIAEGSQILFVEYGAGDLTATPYKPGSWSSSAQGSGQYAKNGFWIYKGEKYQSIPPARGLHYGEMKALAYIDQHGTEAFE